MRQFPSRLRRLDDALADLPLEEPMLLTELDGFLTGILVCPDPIAPVEWLPVVWGGEGTGGAPFDDLADVQWFADAVMARQNEIARDLRRGKPRPIFDVDERDGEVLWEFWVDGFAQAMDLRPDRWAAAAEGYDQDVADALSRLSVLIGVARQGTDLDAVELDAVHDEAPAVIPSIMLRLHAAWFRSDAAGRIGAVATSGATVAKIGRNEPCSCGSGKKFKRCCG